MKKLQNISRKVLISSLAMLPLGSLQADPMNITATVLQVCELGTITDVAFGNLLPGSGVDASTFSTVQWRCSAGTNADISIDEGGNGNRTMNGPGVDTVAYDLYQDAGLTTRWGSIPAEVSNVNGAGMAAFNSATVYGEALHADYVDAQQGAYSDIVDVLITIN